MLQVECTTLDRYSGYAARGVLLLLHHRQSMQSGSTPPIKITWTMEQERCAEAIQDLMNSKDTACGGWSVALHDVFLSLFFNVKKVHHRYMHEDPIPIIPMLMNLDADTRSWGLFNKLSNTAAGLLFCMRLIAATHTLNKSDQLCNSDEVISGIPCTNFSYNPC